VGLTKDLCEIIHATSFDTLGAECVARVKDAIADGVAVALAGCDEEPITIGVAHAQSLGGAPQASVWGWNCKASVVQATYLNAMSTHVLDFEPMWSPPTHAVSPTVPVALALAEWKGATGRQLVTAVAKGLEIQGRMQFAGNLFAPEELAFHPPGFAGVLGSAIVAAELLGLDVDRMRHALGIAASRAGTLLANVGSMTKCTHCGGAAAAGLDAALLAQRGFTANPDVLEAHKGLLATFYATGFDEARLLAYGKPHRVVDPGLAIKLFPSQYATHYAITAGLDVHRQAGGAHIRRAHIVSPVMKYIDRPQPVTGLAGKFSLQYTAAAAMLDGKVGIDSFTEERRHRPDMVELLANITLTQDAAIVGDFHHMHVAIDTELDSGVTVGAICRGPQGAWGVPLAPSAHRDKLTDCLRRALPPAKMDELLGMFERLDTLDADGVARLVALIASSKHGNM
jgi:2-methylcitrate dehydratase PrpD